MDFEGLSVDQLNILSGHLADDIKKLGYEIQDKERSFKSLTERRDKARAELTHAQSYVDDAERQMTSMRRRQNALAVLRLKIEAAIPAEEEDDE